jgi:transcription elongation factor Elf1
MSNYYELIELNPTATLAEIENAIDTRYNQWRALVTHHDDKIRDQANQAMRMLEQIRATLTDPAKRGVYDEAIGVKGATAGLVDPTAVMNMPRVTMPPPPPPPRPPVAKQVVSEASTSKLWACQKCGEKNPEHTQFCYNCGTQLVRECPKCHKNTSLVSTGFCGNCGANYEETVKRIELRTQLAKDLIDITIQQNNFMEEYQMLREKAGKVAKDKYEIERQVWGGVILIVLGVALAFAGLGSGPSGILLLFGGSAILVGIASIYFAVQAKNSADSKRYAQVELFQKQADEKKNQANALETPMLKLREQLKELAD